MTSTGHPAIDASGPLMIGITGTFGVGKDTLADILARALVLIRAAFADELKNQATEMLADRLHAYPRTLRPFLDEHKTDVFGPVLQGLGELCRVWHGRDFWISVLERSLERQGITRVVIPDVRYQNEADWIRSKGGFIIGIRGRSHRPDDQRDRRHASETEVPALVAHADRVMTNTGTLEQFEDRAKKFADAIKSGAVTW